MRPPVLLPMHSYMEQVSSTVDRQQAPPKAACHPMAACTPMQRHSSMHPHAASKVVKRNETCSPRHRTENRCPSCRERFIVISRKLLAKDTDDGEDGKEHKAPKRMRGEVLETIIIEDKVQVCQLCSACMHAALEPAVHVPPCRSPHLRTLIDSTLPPTLPQMLPAGVATRRASKPGPGEPPL